MSAVSLCCALRVSTSLMRRLVRNRQDASGPRDDVMVGDPCKKGIFSNAMRA